MSRHRKLIEGFPVDNGSDVDGRGQQGSTGVTRGQQVSEGVSRLLKGSLGINDTLNALICT